MDWQQVLWHNVFGEMTRNFLAGDELETQVVVPQG
jgi:hypothetical protein